MADNFRIAGFLPKQYGTDPRAHLLQRLESLTRAQSGNSTQANELYNILFGTGPSAELATLDREDPETSLLASLQQPQTGAIDKAANARGVAEADTERINKPIDQPGNIADVFKRLQGVGGNDFSGALDAVTGSGGNSFDPNKLPKDRSVYDDFFANASQQNSPTPSIPTEAPFSDRGVQSGMVKPTLSGKVAVPQTSNTAQSVDAASAGGFDLGALLKKLGGAALSDTGLTALGIAGQGIGGIMQGRAQSKADKGARREQRTNNAIAAFTGGNAAQAAPRQANSTGGNILSALGQTLGGVANARRADQATEFDQDLETQKLGILQDRNDTQRYVAEQNARARGGSGDGEGDRNKKLETATSSFGIYLDALKKAEVGGVGADFLLDIPLLKRQFPEATSAKGLSEAVALNMAVAIQGSRPSEGDREAMVLMLPLVGDTQAERDAKTRNVQALLAAAKNGPLPEGSIVAAYQKLSGGTSVGSKSIDEMTEEEIDRETAQLGG